MKNLKILIGVTVLMSIFSCEIDELSSDQITDQELQMNHLLEVKKSINNQLIYDSPSEDEEHSGVGDQIGGTDDRKDDIRDDTRDDLLNEEYITIEDQIDGTDERKKINMKNDYNI